MALQDSALRSVPLSAVLHESLRPLHSDSWHAVLAGGRAAGARAQQHQWHSQNSALERHQHPGAGVRSTQPNNTELFSCFEEDIISLQAAELQRLEHGDISGILKKALENAVDIEAPVFFANDGGPQSTLSSSSAHSPLKHLQVLQSMECTAALLNGFTLRLRSCGNLLWIHTAQLSADPCHKDLWCDSHVSSARWACTVRCSASAPS